ncbi:hypothetical protein PENARI_c020G01487, partial [Penicillium arizonense]
APKKQAAGTRKREVVRHEQSVVNLPILTGAQGARISAAFPPLPEARRKSSPGKAGSVLTTPHISTTTTNWTYRVSFFIPAIGTLWLVYYHAYHVKATAASKQLDAQKQKVSITGPNCITFLVAAEVFPTPIRATAHGLSAAAGKLGALVIAVIGSYTTTQQQFYIVPWFGLAGVLTKLFLPDTTGLDLREQERRWLHIRQGREHGYHGPAVHRKHLSIWERWMGKGKHYDADLGYQMKVKEFRAEWEAAMAGSLYTYFERTSPMIRGVEKSEVEPTALPVGTRDDQDTLGWE